MTLETFFFAHKNSDGGIYHACTVTDLDDGPLPSRERRAMAKAIARTGLPAHELLASPPIPVTAFEMTSVHERTADGTGWIQRPSLFIPIYGSDADAFRIVRKELTWLAMQPLETELYTYSPRPTAEVNQPSNPAGEPLTQGDRA